MSYNIVINQQVSSPSPDKVTPKVKDPKHVEAALKDRENYIKTKRKIFKG